MKRLSNYSVLLLAALTMTSFVGCGKNKADLEATIETLETVGKARAKPTTEKSSMYTVSTTAQLSSADFPFPGEPMPQPSWDPTPQPTWEPTPHPTWHPAPQPSHSPSPIDGPTFGGPSQNTTLILGKPCTVSEPQMDSSHLDFGNFESKIGGDQCPVEYSSSIRMDMSSGEVSFSMHFKARTEEARKLSDVDLLDLGFTVKAKDNGKAADIKVSFTANSQKRGLLEMNLEGEVKGQDERNASGELAGSIKMGDKESDIKQVVKMDNGKQTTETYINGEKLTDEQAKRVSGALSHEDDSKK